MYAQQPVLRGQPRRSSNAGIIVLLIGGAVGLLVVGGFVFLVVLGVVLERTGAVPPASATATTTVAAPPSSGWPMEFEPIDDRGSSTGAATTTFDEHRKDGSAQRIAVSVRAPSPFLSLGASSFSFEVCKLQDGERSRFHCDVQNLFVDPAKTKQREGTRTYTIDDGPGTYQARVVEFGTWGADDEVFSSATFEAR